MLHSYDDFFAGDFFETKEVREYLEGRGGREIFLEQVTKVRGVEADYFETLDITPAEQFFALLARELERPLARRIWLCEKLDLLINYRKTFERRAIRSLLS